VSIGPLRASRVSRGCQGARSLQVCQWEGIHTRDQSAKLAHLFDAEKPDAAAEQVDRFLGFSQEPLDDTFLGHSHLRLHEGTRQSRPPARYRGGGTSTTVSIRMVEEIQTNVNRFLSESQLTAGTNAYFHCPQ
jgi:hypothetical protein